MSDLICAPFSRERFEDLQQLITANAKARWPRTSYLLNSDVAWRLPGSAPRENPRLWYDDRGVAAYAWFSPNSPIAFDIRTDLAIDSPIGLEVITWLEVRRAEFPAFYPWLLALNSMNEWEQALTDGLPTKPAENKLL